MTCGCCFANIWNRVIFAVIVASSSLTAVAPQTVQISKASGAAAELFQTIDRRSSIDAMDDGGDSIEDLEGSIELRNVNFAYPTRSNVPVFNNFSLTIPANETTALVGPSGSGKSTIVGLLERWYAPSGGDILLDGIPVEKLNVQWLRSNIRLVQQV
jgi:ATP-binding cassette subfamily B (MDR/TAP) protein 1